MAASQVATAFFASSYAESLLSPYVTYLLSLFLSSICFFATADKFIVLTTIPGSKSAHGTLVRRPAVLVSGNCDCSWRWRQFGMVLTRWFKHRFRYACRKMDANCII